MRISDWSSDVCFSDLAWPDDQLPPARLAGDRVRLGGELVAGQGMADADSIRLVRVQPAIGMVRDRERPEFRAAIELQLIRPDRKSVVQGKSVSVRVELGVRRTIIKKHKSHQKL